MWLSGKQVKHTWLCKEALACSSRPHGAAHENKGTCSKATRTGFLQQLTMYQASNCHGFPLNGLCHKSKENRIIEVNHRLSKLKQEAKRGLLSDEGITKRRQRCGDVEPVFANIKNNHGQTFYATW